MSLRLYSWNVNGIRAVIKKDALQSFIRTHSPDILCLQETKSDPQELPIDFAEYTEYWNSGIRKGYAGTAIFTRSQPLTVTYNLPESIAREYKLTHDGYGHPNTEGRVVTAEYDAFFVVNVYTPNSKEDLSRIPLRYTQWDPACLAYCRHLQKVKPVIYCGDLNVAYTPVDLARPKENEGKKGYTREEREGLQRFIDAGFLDTFRMFTQGTGYYTWWAAWGGARARNVGWRIDYILVSETLKTHVVDAQIHPDVMGSDHCPVSISLRL